MNYIVSQILVIIGVALISITYFIKNKNVILFITCAIAICYGLSYLLLGAYAGVFINIMSVIRGVWLYLDSKKDGKNSIISLIVCTIAFIIGGIVTFNIWADVLVIIAGIIYTYAVWQNKIDIFRWISCICDILFLIYGIVIMSIMGIITEIVLIVVGCIGIIRWYMSNKNKEAK